jgi:hypothetical protein
MAALIERVLLPFRNEHLAALAHGATLAVGGERRAFTTDTFVVKPIFFPGGDIGSLAVHGTVNDFAMCGATPLYLSAGLDLRGGPAIAIDLRQNGQSDHHGFRGNEYVRVWATFSAKPPAPGIPAIAGFLSTVTAQRVDVVVGHVEPRPGSPSRCEGASPRQPCQEAVAADARVQHHAPGIVGDHAPDAPRVVPSGEAWSAASARSVCASGGTRCEHQHLVAEVDPQHSPLDDQRLIRHPRRLGRRRRHPNDHRPDSGSRRPA